MRPDDDVRWYRERAERAETALKEATQLPAVSLRDYFAGQAMAAFLTQEDFLAEGDAAIAREAYKSADAMLLARGDERPARIAALNWFHAEVLRISTSDDYDAIGGMNAIAQLYGDDRYKPIDWKEQTPEQEARDLLHRLGHPRAQEMTAGDVVELANLLAARRRR